MGATLPTAAQWVESTPDGVAWIGFLYGGNTVGAVFGSVLAGFYLLRVYDLTIATFAAVAIHVGVAGVGPLLAAPGSTAPAPGPGPLRPLTAWVLYFTIR